MQAVKDVEQLLDILSHVKNGMTLSEEDREFITGDKDLVRRQKKIRQEHVKDVLEETEVEAQQRQLGPAAKQELKRKVKKAALKEAEEIFIPTPVEGSVKVLADWQVTRMGQLASQLQKGGLDEEKKAKIIKDIGKAEDMAGAIYDLFAGVNELKIDIQKRDKDQDIGISNAAG